MGLNTLELVGQIADLKDIDYKNTLAISALIELLVEKGIISRQEFAQKAHELEKSTLAEIVLARRKSR